MVPCPALPVPPDLRHFPWRTFGNPLDPFPLRARPATPACRTPPRVPLLRTLQAILLVERQTHRQLFPGAVFLHSVLAPWAALGAAGAKSTWTPEDRGLWAVFCASDGRGGPGCLGLRHGLREAGIPAGRRQAPAPRQAG